MVRISRIVVLAAFCSCLLSQAGTAGATDDETRQGSQPKESQETWYTDYSEAVRAAEVYGKMLLIVFHDPQRPAVLQAFEKSTLADAGVQSRLDRYVLAKLPVTATTVINGEEVTLLEHSAFAEMQRREGISVIDYANSGTSHYGRVVSTFPFLPGHYYTPERMNVILDLPRGSLTQRTMIYAVRIHPERPKSTTGDFHPVLADEASSHSVHQASIRNQGHHQWGSRFNRINSRMGMGLLAQEVVAESWPGEGLVEACIECVNSWRQSSGHWGAVRSRHSHFGYDIKRGSNGIWYATGIFAGGGFRR